MHSIVDPNLEVTEKQCIVSLVRKDDHALILIERPGEAKWYDIVPKKRIHPYNMPFGSFFVSLRYLNSKIEAVVRDCPRENDARQGIPELIHKRMTKKVLFAEQHWNPDTDSWPCETANVEKMLKAIYKDMYPEKGKKVYLQLSGHHNPNCVTWCWEKLKIAGIDARNNNIQNIIAVRGSKNIGSHRDSCV